MSQDIDDEPSFKWWFPYTLIKRDTIIAAVKARVRVATHKYGIEVPRSIEHAKQLDKKNGYKFWIQALSKEIHNVSIAFELLEQLKGNGDVIHFLCICLYQKSIDILLV